MVKKLELKKQIGLYWPPAVTVDIVIFSIEGGYLKTLLIKRVQSPFENQWALPGGFLLRDENPEKGALRILKDKAGIKNIYIEQLYTFSGMGRDPRGDIITIAYFALVPINKIKIIKTKKTQTPKFHTLKKLPKLAFDHRHIIKYSLKRLQSKLEYTNIVYSLLPAYFTFNQLQESGKGPLESL